MTTSLIISAKMPKTTNKGNKPENRAIGKTIAQTIVKEVLVDPIGLMIKNAITSGTYRITINVLTFLRFKLDTYVLFPNSAKVFARLSITAILLRFSCPSFPIRSLNSKNVDSIKEGLSLSIKVT